LLARLSGLGKKKKEFQTFLPSKVQGEQKKKELDVFGEVTICL